ncbi:MAG: FG-GAP-like repeat-containing protein, partial [Cylindrospermopsis raciborskii 1523720]|uniref:FG-GAP-like repeat-containing protein n=1 Tax=Cylindrospermopsis raciborskii TaxID=77022 RepID=UPI002B49BF1B
MTPLINQALSLVYTQLSYFSESSNYYQVLSTAFGNNYDRDIAEKLKLHWQQVNFTQIPQIEILDGGILGSAYGAYAREANKIYLSRNFVKNNTAEVIGRVILEEVGHFVDGQLNVEDSEGDEGAIFAELVVGNSLDDQALRKLRTESDFGVITLNGQQVHVEQSSSLSLPGVAAGSVAWADYDGDGNQDFLLTGYSSNNSPIAKLYRKTDNGFEEDKSISLPGVYDGSVAWADYNGDGKQDFLLTGYSSNNSPIAKLYRNTGDGFIEDTSVSLPGVGAGSVAWADYNGDGKQDFLLTGSSSSGDIAKLYRKTGDGFIEDTSVSLPGVGAGSVAWADYDGDGKQDFLLTGWDGSKPITLLVVSKEIFSDLTLAVSPTSVAEDGTNNLVYTFTRTGVISNALTVNYTIGGTATNGTDYNNIGTSVTFAAGSSTATVTVDPTADTTAESDETVILTLASGTGYTIAAGTRSGVGGTITNDDYGTYYSSVLWFDYNKDKKDDYLLTGYTSEKPVSQVYLFNSEDFKAEDISSDKKGVFAGSVALSSDEKYLLLTGATEFDKRSASKPISKLYKNTD